MDPGFYMQRCLFLAQLGAGFTRPNPMVGAVLVHDDRIIGEGYHQQYGESHAEVNCINSVNDADRGLIKNSTLYVSLEPCAHFGKTPPCADLVISHGIPGVVVGARDPFVQVNGKGLEKLRAAGIRVEQGLMEKECIELNKRFFTYHTKQRPYVILKWAQTADGFIANEDGNQRLLISNEMTNLLVHKWRMEEAAILVGTNTALLDDPSLTNRFWNGPSPARVVIDMDLKLPSTLKLFDGEHPTIVFNTTRTGEERGINYIKIDKEASLSHQVLGKLHKLDIQSVLIEGGAAILNTFINDNAWDEARVIKNTGLTIGKGLEAPGIEMLPYSIEKSLNDTIEIYRNE